MCLRADMIPRASAASVEALLAQLARKGLVKETVKKAGNVVSTVSRKLLNVSADIPTEHNCEDQLENRSSLKSLASQCSEASIDWSEGTQAGVVVPRRLYAPGTLIWLADSADKEIGVDRSKGFVALQASSRTVFRDIQLLPGMLTNHFMGRYSSAISNVVVSD